MARSSPPADWSQEYAAQVVQDFLGSGLTAAEFARQRGFSARRSAWLQLQSERRGSASPPRLVELVASVPLAPEDGPHCDGLRIFCPSGHTVLVAAGDLTAALTATFRALREAAC